MMYKKLEKYFLYFLSPLFQNKIPSEPGGSIPNWLLLKSQQGKHILLYLKLIIKKNNLLACCLFQHSYLPT